MALFSFSIFLGIILVLAVSVVLFLKRRYTYWSSRGVTQLEPKLLIGDLNFKKNIDVTFLEYYNKFKAKGLKVGGVYTFWKPNLMVLDTDFLKLIMIKDFDFFVNRGQGRLNEKDPLAGMLPFLADEQWKTLRSKLTPTFTSGKMIMMFDTFVECSQLFKETLITCAETTNEVDIKDVLNKFTIEVIGSCAFGLNCNTLKDPDSEFIKFIRIALKPSVAKRYMRFLMPILPSSLVSLLNLHIVSNVVESFFVNLVKDMVEYRETHDVFRKDFMHLLIQLKNRGKVTDDEKIRDENGATKSFLTMNEICAQCFIFFMAGFDTSSTTMTFALYELSLNQVIQEKLRQEIKNVLRKHNSNLTYDAISEMNYLDHVIKETLRLHPPVGHLKRECNNDYELPNSNLMIKKGTMILIPVLGIHMDEKYYPNPENFDPDRFTEKNSAKRPGCTWLPFGEGPRHCIGLRFGMLQAKVGLLTVLKDFKVTINERTKIPLVIHNGSAARRAVGGIWLNIHRLNEN